MPYIKSSHYVSALTLPENSGDLNFAITELLLRYLDQHGESYGMINDCLGALTGATHEFYRRVVVPFEEKKKEENGDVYVGLRRF